MECRCGCRFNWSEARTLVPCRRLHWTTADGPERFWGTTCPDCSPIATAKLAALRTTAVVVAPVAVGVGITGAAVGITGAAVVAAVPAVTFGPLALAYEPVRSCRGKTRNPFARAAACGAGKVVDMCVGIGLWVGSALNSD